MKSSLFIAEISEVMEKHNLMVSSFKLDSDSEKLKIEIEGIENTNKHDDFAGALIPYSLNEGSIWQ